MHPHDFMRKEDSYNRTPSGRKYSALLDEMPGWRVTKQLSACKGHMLCWAPELHRGMTLVSRAPIPTAA